MTNAGVFFDPLRVAPLLHLSGQQRLRRFALSWLQLCPCRRLQRLFFGVEWKIIRLQMLVVGPGASPMFR